MPSQPLQLRFLYMHPHPPQENCRQVKRPHVRVCRIWTVRAQDRCLGMPQQARCSTSQTLQLRLVLHASTSAAEIPKKYKRQCACLPDLDIKGRSWGISAGQARCSPSQQLYMHPRPPRKFPAGRNVHMLGCYLRHHWTGAWGISAGQARCSTSQPLGLRLLYMVHPHRNSPADL